MGYRPVVAAEKPINGSIPVVARVARRWARPQLSSKVFDELLFDDRDFVLADRTRRPAHPLSCPVRWIQR